MSEKPLDLGWIIRSLEVVAKPLGPNETGLARLEGLRTFIESLKAARGPVEPVPAPVGLDLAEFESEMAANTITARGWEMIESLIAEVRRLRASLSPRPATGAREWVMVKSKLAAEPWNSFTHEKYAEGNLKAAIELGEVSGPREDWEVFRVREILRPAPATGAREPREWDMKWERGEIRFRPLFDTKPTKSAWPYPDGQFIRVREVFPVEAPATGADQGGAA